VSCPPHDALSRPFPSPSHYFFLSRYRCRVAFFFLKLRLQDIIGNPCFEYLASTPITFAVTMRLCREKGLPLFFPVLFASVKLSAFSRPPFTVHPLSPPPVLIPRMQPDFFWFLPPQLTLKMFLGGFGRLDCFFPPFFLSFGRSALVEKPLSPFSSTCEMSLSLPVATGSSPFVFPPT